MLRNVLLVMALGALPAGAGPALGKIDFQVTGGSAAARAHFARGLLAMHSFWYDEAQTEFAAATKADPSFAMGWWGLAMSHARLLWQDDDLPVGREALAKITSTDKLSAREQAWIDAARALYIDQPMIARRQAFAAALDKMHHDFPADDEITTFDALAMISSYLPDDPDVLAIRARAAALAMDVFQRNPQHPGAAHYIIHALDTPELAPMALPAAKVYAKIAPEAFHARHMPAHIFTRLGLWGDALASCQAAWDASLAWVKRDKLTVDKQDWHSQNWIMSIEMQLGHRKKAEAALATAGAAVRAGMDRDFRGMYVDWVTSYLGYTDDWARADELLAPLAGPVVDKPAPGAAPACHPGAPDPDRPPKELGEQMSINNLKLSAATRRHDLPASKKLLAETEALLDKMRPFIEKQIGKDEWAKHEPDRKREHDTILAAAGGDYRHLLELLRKTAEILDKQPNSENGIFDPGLHAGIAEVLMRMQKPKEALAELEPLLKRHPRHAWLRRDAARAAVAAGDAAKAKRYYQEVVDIWATADADVPGLDEARKYVAAH